MVCALFLKINLDKRKKDGCVHSELHLIGTTVPTDKFIFHCVELPVGKSRVTFII